MNKPYGLGWSEMQRFRTDQLGSVLELTAKLGNVARISLIGQRITLISEPDLIRELLVKNSQRLRRDPFTYRVLRRITGEGLFSSEGNVWQRKRKLIQPIFHAAHVNDFVNAFGAATRMKYQQWKVGETLQLDQEMMALTLTIICETMFSADIGEHIPTLSGLLSTMTAEAESQLKSLPTPEWLPTRGKRRQQKAIDGIYALLRGIVEKRKEQSELGEEQSDDSVPSDLLTMLLTARDEYGHPMSTEEILHECMTIFFAGHETTAVALTWTWTLLLKHPDLLTRVRMEVSEIVGTKPVSLEHVKELTYLTQVIKEAMRLYPPAPGFGRTPAEQIRIGEHEFAPGETLIVSTYALHRQSRFYPNPEQFDPDRFAPDAAELERYAYIPFGAGTRTCIGNAFAMLEMQVVLATMVQSVEISLLSEQEIVPETVLTLRPKNGVRVRVEKKNNAIYTG